MPWKPDKLLTFLGGRGSTTVKWPCWPDIHTTDACDDADEVAWHIVGALLSADRGFCLDCLVATLSNFLWESTRIWPFLWRVDTVLSETEHSRSLKSVFFHILNQIFKSTVALATIAVQNQRSNGFAFTERSGPDFQVRLCSPVTNREGLWCTALEFGLQDVLLQS